MASHRDMPLGHVQRMGEQLTWTLTETDIGTSYVCYDGRPMFWTKCGHRCSVDLCELACFLRRPGAKWPPADRIAGYCGWCTSSVGEHPEDAVMRVMPNQQACCSSFILGGLEAVAELVG